MFLQFFPVVGASPVTPSSTLWGHTEVKFPAQSSPEGTWVALQ